MLKSAGLLMGSFLGLNSFSKAFAMEKHRNHTVDQPRIALIIDDIGYSLSHARQLLNIGVPITFAILPRLVYSYDLALEIHDNGHEILLHQPMEPYNIDSFDPGPGALYVGDGADRIERIIEDNIAGVPYAVGVNNHMGSSFTEDRDKMLIVLKELKKRQLFYIDSRTTIDTVGFETAKAIGLPVASRDVFLDNQLVAKAIKIQLERLLSIARYSGSAIGIAHPHIETLNTLEGCSSKLKEETRIKLGISNIPRIEPVKNFV